MGPLEREGCTVCFTGVGSRPRLRREEKTHQPCYAGSVALSFPDFQNVRATIFEVLCSLSYLES